MAVDVVSGEARIAVGEHQRERQHARFVHVVEVLDVVGGFAQLFAHVVIRQEEHRFGVDLIIIVLNSATSLVFVFWSDFAVGFNGEQGVELVHHSRFAFHLVVGLLLVFFGVVFGNLFLLGRERTRAVVVALAASHVAHAALALAAGI